MPVVLNIKPEDVDNNEKRSKYTVSVLGCGQTGIFFAIAFAMAGFKVSCFDADLSVVRKVARGKTPFSQQEIEGKLRNLIGLGQLSVTSDIKKTVSQSDIMVIAIPAKIDAQKKVDYTELINACKQVGASLHPGVLIICSSIVGFGCIEGTMKETIENSSGFKVEQDFGLAYVPVHNTEACLMFQSPSFEFKVAAIGKNSLETSANILKTITKNVNSISNVKTAEIATLFAVAKADTSTALANELAIFCENANADYFEIIKLLKLNDERSCPTAVNEDNRDEAYLLLESADNINAKLRLPALSRQINEDMIKHAVNLTQEALRSCGKTLRRARVGILGSLNPTTATAVFVKMLELKGAKASLYCTAPKREISDFAVAKSSLNEAVEGSDCIVVLTKEEPFRHLNLKKLKALTKTPTVIVDLAGAFQPEEVRIEGFIYRGLGRGKEEK